MAYPLLPTTSMLAESSQSVTCDEFKNSLPSTLTLEIMNPPPNKSWQITNFDDVKAILVCSNAGQFSAYCVEDKLIESADHRLPSVHVGYLAALGIQGYTNWPIERAQMVLQLMEELRNSIKLKQNEQFPHDIASSDVRLPDRATARASSILFGATFSIERDD